MVHVWVAAAVAARQHDQTFVAVHSEAAARLRDSLDPLALR